MDLWIRSQDKRILKKIEYLEVDEFDGIITDDECNHLGTYKNQERALEVLDEIQNCITGYTKVDTITWGNEALPYEVEPTNFYQMPKE